MRSALIIALFATITALGASETSEHPTLPLGSPAPEFSLPGVDGRTYSLKDFAAAKVLVVIFTSVHCPTAQAYEGRIKQLVPDYRPRGVAFVAINPNNPDAVRLDEQGYTDLDDTFESMKIRAADRQFNYPFLDDGPTEAVARQYGPAATPHVFIFDAARRLRFQGRIDDSEREGLVKNHDTRNALDALLAGREPPVTETMVVRLLDQVGRQGRSPTAGGGEQVRPGAGVAGARRRRGAAANCAPTSPARSGWSTSGRRGAGRASRSSTSWSRPT